MKRIFLLLVMAVFAIALNAQTVPRDKVVVEDATGTW
jgi:hypothetical protein